MTSSDSCFTKCSSLKDWNTGLQTGVGFNHASDWQGNPLCTCLYEDGGLPSSSDPTLSGITGSSNDGSGTGYPRGSNGNGLSCYSLPLLASKVRVQLRGQNFLHLREVQVFDDNGDDVALGKSAIQSSDYQASTSAYLYASLGNDGDFDSMMHTNNDLSKYCV